MKKTFVLLSCLIASAGAYAQPIKSPDINGPVKLEDLVEKYKYQVEEQEGKGAATWEEEEEEGAKYHLGRWQWYMERHTDEDGYLISPAKTFTEWKKYQTAQTVKKRSSKTTANPSNWTFQGPDTSRANGNGIGRINTVAFHPTDTNTFWIGSAGGGAWKTTNGGMTWTAVNDRIPVLGVSDIDFNPLNPNTIYMCTGDRDHADTYSIGVLKSTDGGRTWDTTGLVWEPRSNRLTNELVINPLDTNSLTLAASIGIYKSYDGGKSWAKNESGHYKQLLYHPVDTSILFAASYGDPNGNNGIKRSDDGGRTWNSVLSVQATSRVAIAVTPANPAIVKAIVANNSYGLEGIYSSSDTGKTFAKVFSDSSCTRNILANTPRGNQCGGQGWYDLSLAISPLSDQLMVAGGVNTWYSTDGGLSWTIANQWTSSLPGVKVVHADKHYHVFHPLKPDQLFECNDGGIYTTNNPTGGIWTDITNGLGITQFYRVAVSNSAPFVIGGAQDNGSKKLQNTVLTELTGGDGMECQINPFNNSIFYTSIQYGELRRTINGGANFTDIQNSIPGTPEGEWITPFVLRPDSPSIVIAGYQNVFISRNSGTSWTTASPAYGADIKRIAVSPADSNYIYITVGTSRTINYTKDFGATWQTLSVPYTGTISDIHTGPKDATEVWVTFSGYTTSANGGKVARYKNGQWTLRNDNLPNIPVNCIEIDSADNTVYIGTDIGVFYETPLMTAWEEYNGGLPSVEVVDLDINYTSGELWAATFGRGMWKTPKNDININPTVVNSIPLAKTITVYPNPSYGKFEIRTDNAALKGQAASIQILNLTGASVWTGNITFGQNGLASVNPSDLPAGAYIINVYKGNLLFAKERVVIYK